MTEENSEFSESDEETRNELTHAKYGILNYTEEQANALNKTVLETRVPAWRASQVSLVAASSVQKLTVCPDGCPLW